MTRSFLVDRQRHAKGHDTQLKELHERLAALQVEFAKTKKTAGTFEQRFVAKQLIVQASQVVSEAEASLKKAVDASVPLTQDAGVFFSC